MEYQSLKQMMLHAMKPAIKTVVDSSAHWKGKSVDMNDGQKFVLVWIRTMKEDDKLLQMKIVFEHEVEEFLKEFQMVNKDDDVLKLTDVLFANQLEWK